MNRKHARCRGSGFVPLEMLAVIIVISVLLGLGVIVVRSARYQAHLTQAQMRLKQIGLALDLFYNKYGNYPASGKNLPMQLSEFIQDKRVFQNPFIDGETPGATVSLLYHEPSGQGGDMPEVYLTAMVSEDGTTAVVLKTMGKVLTNGDLDFDLDSYTETKVVTMTAAETDGEDEQDDGRPHPRLAIFVTCDTEQASNRGHGNNLDQDDEDNPGQGGALSDESLATSPDQIDGVDNDEYVNRLYRIKNDLVTIGIANPTEEGNDAAGVTADVSVVSGGDFLSKLDFTESVGDVPAGETVPFTFSLGVNNDWKKADSGTEIRLRIEVTAETNDPEANVGEAVEVVIVKK
jgi:hypothetical protein